MVPLWKRNEYIAKENLSLVAYVQSSCDTPSGRDEYVSELMKHIKIDSYGYCLHNKGPQILLCQKFFSRLLKQF